MKIKVHTFTGDSERDKEYRTHPNVHFRSVVLLSFEEFRSRIRRTTAVSVEQGTGGADITKTKVCRQNTTTTTTYKIKFKKPSTEEKKYMFLL